MAVLEDLTKGAVVRGVLPDALVTVIDVQWHGSAAIELTYKDSLGKLGHELMYIPSPFRDPHQRYPGIVPYGQLVRGNAVGDLPPGQALARRGRAGQAGIC